MADILNISAAAIDFHRKNLRAKLGIKNKGNNLRSYISITIPGKRIEE